VSTVLHPVSEEGIATRDIAAAPGQFLNVPVESIPADQAAAHFDWIGMFFGADAPASSTAWRPLCVHVHLPAANDRIGTVSASPAHNTAPAESPLLPLQSTIQRAKPSAPGQSVAR
jgi:hypothetical protein